MARDDRITVRFTPTDGTEVRRRAALHGTDVAKYLRACALSRTPGGEDSADAWWECLSLPRKEQVRRWLENPGAANSPMPGQETAFTLEDPCA